MSINLDPAQEKAVLDNEGPGLIIAGAGSGKTRVIVQRVAELVRNSVNPSTILCVTFTRNAAAEVRSRLKDILGEHSANQIWIETFHGLCLRILSEYGFKLGYKKGFTVYDERDSIDVVEQVLQDLNIKKSATREAQRIHKARLGDETDPVMIEYISRLKNANALDYTGLIINCTNLLEKYDDVLQFYRNKFKYIMIDEYQDINDHQYHLVGRFWDEWRNVCVVGDPRQCIYKFQGANIEHIKDFRKDFPESSHTKLSTNYRSTSQIVNAANILISHNNESYEPMVSHRGKGRHDLSYTIYEDEVAEAGAIASQIKQLIEGRDFFDYKDIAVLYRIHRLEPLISSALKRADIPFKVVGSANNLFKYEEVLRLQDYLRIAVNTSDALALKRIMNLPDRGISFIDFLRIESQTELMEISIIDSIEKFYHDKRMPCEWINQVKEYSEKGLVDYAEWIVKVLSEHYESQKLNNKIQNLNKALEVIKMWRVQNGDSIEDFLEAVSESNVTREELAPQEEDAVKLMTVHASKGLEFPVVFIPGLEENVFPISSEDDEIPEERRLFYVGITRAEDVLIMSSAKQRTQHSKTIKPEPSRFLEEINIFRQKKGYHV